MRGETIVETEIRRRIRIAVAAYAYEFQDHSIMSDQQYDELSLLIRPEIATGNTVMDRFFRTKFTPHTGQWIYRHPNLQGIARIYFKYLSPHRNPHPHE